MHLFSNRARLAAAALITVSLTLVVGPAQAHHDPLTPRSHFTMKPDGSSGTTEGGAGIPNVDSVKKTNATYYGDTGNGISNKESSPYITEMDKIIRHATKDLRRVHADKSRHHHVKPAIVFDADDTTLWTYDMEVGAMHFNYDPALQDIWVQDERFPATPAMVKFVAKAAKLGYTVFGLTGRNDDQKAATLGNLTKDGYTEFTADRFYTKWTGTGTSQQPSYIHCVVADKCTTVEFKSQTRKHIESLGYDIKLNVGDQFSDLQGGYSDKTLKLPNPTYYLP